jgi:hypothetical protein
MKISGWEKLSGITYKGYSIINPMVNPESTQYFADILDISTNYKIDLQLDTEAGFGDSYVLKLSDIRNKVYVQRMIKFDMLKSISNFRMMFEFCIEDYILEFDNLKTIEPIAKSSSLIPTFDDFAKMWKQTPIGEMTQALTNK